MLSMRSDNLRFSSWVDSGLLVVVTIIISMVVSVFFVLFYVQYEWCHVLFKNYTVSILEGCIYTNKQDRWVVGLG